MTSITATAALARLSGLLLCRAYLGGKIEHLGDGRGRISGDDHQIEAQFLGLCQRVAGVDRALVDAFGVDQLDFGGSDILIAERPIFLGRYGSHGSANGRCPSAVERECPEKRR